MQLNGCGAGAVSKYTSTDWWTLAITLTFRHKRTIYCIVQKYVQSITHFLSDTIFSEFISRNNIQYTVCLVYIWIINNNQRYKEFIKKVKERMMTAMYNTVYMISFTQCIHLLFKSSFHYFFFFFFTFYTRCLKRCFKLWKTYILCVPQNHTQVWHFNWTESILRYKRCFMILNQ